MKYWLFLGLISLLSVLPYLPGLGFYSDDWDYLARFSLSQDQSILGLFNAINTPHTQMRPVHELYLSVLYKLFGLQPLGYHVVNASIQGLINIVLYSVLRRLKLPMLVTLTVPFVYMLLPHYSTDRFWIATFQANLSILFYLLSLYTGLKALSLSAKKAWGWYLLSMVNLIISALSYEVVIPLFLFNIALFYSIRKNQPFLIGGTLLSLIAVILFKTMTTTRLTNGPLQDLSLVYIGYLAYILTSAVWFNFGILGAKLPIIVLTILSNHFNLITFAVSIILGVIIFLYLFFIVSRKENMHFNRSLFLKLTFIGLCIFTLGYAIFFANNNIGFTAAGIGNRVAIAAAIGVALSYVGVVGWVSSFVRAKKSATAVFSMCIALICASGFLINTTIASFWVTAYRQEQQVLADIHQHVPVIPKGSTLLLDGICPYIGPGIVFESSWDLKGALQILYQDNTLKADVIKPTIKLKNDGIHTYIYDQDEQYPYRQIFVYNYKTKQTHIIPNKESALHYFKTVNPDNNICPKGTEGNGVTIF